MKKLFLNFIQIVTKTKVTVIETVITETTLNETVNVENEIKNSEEFNSLSPERIIGLCKKNPTDELLEKGFYAIYHRVDDKITRFNYLKQILWLFDTTDEKFRDLAEKSTKNIYK